MIPAFADDWATVYSTDALNGLQALPEKSVHCAITSPPYWGLRAYLPSDHSDKAMEFGSEKTPEEYVKRLVEVFRALRRVLRDDGTLWLNLGDSYAGSWGNQGRKEERGNQRPINGPMIQNLKPYPETTTKTGSWVNGRSDMKPKDLVGIPWMVAFALRSDGWYLRSDIVWCLSGGTRVYAKTQKGEMPTTIKDLVRLDPKTVKLWNGKKWTQVLGWSRSDAQGDAYEIELRSGERIGCTPAHAWPTRRGNVRAGELAVGDVIQTCQLPEPTELRSPKWLSQDLIGWFVGIYLAEGSMTGDCIQIASHANQTGRHEDLHLLADAFDGHARTHFTIGDSATTNIYSPVLRGIIERYIGGRVAKDKHLKVSCWQRSNQFLWTVLGGYLEGDGCHDKKNNRYRLGFTRNDALAADLRTLCARLGYRISLRASMSKIGKIEYKTYRGEIRPHDSDHWNTKDRGEVVAIRRSRARQFWDIGVEDEPHTFALASGVLTHNSKPNPMPESVTDRPTKSHEYMFLLTKSPRYFFDQEAVRERWADERNGGSATKSLAYSESSGRNGDSGLGPPPPYSGRNIRSVWNIATQPYPGAHYAVFPPALIYPCIKAGTSERGVCGACGAPWERVVERTSNWEERKANGAGSGCAIKGHNTSHGEGMSHTLGATSHTVGWQPTCSCGADTVPATVLDPFIGSGTTALAARKLGRRSIGFDIDERNIKQIEERLGYQGVMF